MPARCFNHLARTWVCQVKQALKRSTARATFFVRPIDERIIANQQATADRFRELGLLPKAITIRDAVWKGPQS